MSATHVRAGKDFHHFSQFLHFMWQIQTFYHPVISFPYTNITFLDFLFGPLPRPLIRGWLPLKCRFNTLGGANVDWVGVLLRLPTK